MNARSSVNRGWYVVGLLSVLSMISYLDRLALNLLVEPVRHELGLSDTQIALLIGPAFAFLHALAALPAALMVDFGNRKLLVGAGVTLWSIMTAASAFAPNYSTLLICRAGVGIGEAVLTPVAISMIGDLFARDRRHTPTAFFLAMSVFGAAFAFIAVAATIDLVSAWGSSLPFGLAALPAWRLVLLCAAVPGLIIVPIFLLTTREPPRSAAAEAAAAGTETETVDRQGEAGATARLFVPLMLGSALVAMASFATMAWFPTYLIRDHGFAPASVGYFFGTATLIGGVVGTLIMPLIAEQIARRHGREDTLLSMVLVAVPLALVGLVMAVLSPVLAVTLFAVALFKGMANGASSSADVVITHVAPARLRGRLSASRMLLTQILGASTGPVLVAWIARAQGASLGTALMIVALGALPVAFLLYWIARPHYQARFRT